MVRSRKRALALASVALAAAAIGCTAIFPLDEFTSGVNDAGADVIADAPLDADSGCVSPQLNCGGTCVDPRSDPAHCGACDIVCKGTTCSKSMCVPFTSLGTPQGTVPAGITFDGTWVSWAVSNPVSEGSAIYRLKPSDVDGGSVKPEERLVPNLTVTHLAQTATSELVYSVENRVVAADAGPQVAQLRYLRFDADAGAKKIADTALRDRVGGLAIRETDAGTTLFWATDNPDASVIGMHLGTLAGETTSGTTQLLYMGTTPLPSVGPLTGADAKQIFMFATNGATTVLGRFDKAFDGVWTLGSSGVSVAGEVNGAAFDGTNLRFTKGNDVMSTTLSASSATLLASIPNSETALALDAVGDDAFVIGVPQDPMDGHVWRQRKKQVIAIGNANVGGRGAVLVTPQWLFWVSAGKLMFLAR